jgi:hypothetical protein
MGHFKDLTGKRYNRLVVLGIAYNKKGQWFWNCKCDCGKEKILSSSRLNSGKTSSCGCLHIDVFRKNVYKHGKSKSLIYKVWRGIKSRCYNKNTECYHRYGGRGITMCQEWTGENGFQNFYDWSICNGYKEEVGKKRNKLTIDRIDNNGNYEPSNCHWVYDKEQQNNKSSNVFLSFNGQAKTIQQWADEYGLNYHFIKNKLKNGMDIGEIIKLKPKKVELYEYRGEKYNKQQLAKMVGCSQSSIAKRIKKGWSIERVVNEPVNMKCVHPKNKLKR